MSRKLLCKVEKGHLAQYEDWFYLLTAEDGTLTVLHDWDHVNVGNMAQNAGSKTYTVEEFYKADVHSKAKSALEDALK